ncbi:MAG: DUF6647 family protein [Alphaproteobacteria bacterium]
MEPGTMNTIVAGLLAWITAHSGYPMPDQTPVVALVPHAYVETLVCGEKCAALGVYTDKNVIYLDDALQIETNVCARSVLLHELVHYLQDKNGQFLNLPPLLRPQLREQEAYGMQEVWLKGNGRTVDFGPNFYLGAFMGPTC